MEIKVSGPLTRKKEEFMRKFLEIIPKLPDSPVPPSALAIQPAVPLVSEQIQQEPTTQ